MKESRTAELQYSGDQGRIELVVPHGTKTEELGKLLDSVILRDALGRLPRGCPACTSGDHFLIRERLENVIRVDLDTGQVIGP
jgi:hypothetical protein